ncbi:MAG: diacylglycerol kinase family protein [Kofleriaceae bacterium]
MSAPGPAVLVGNPTAHSGGAAALLQRARALLDAEGIGHRFVPTEAAGGTVEQVRRAIDDGGARLVIYLGGDGTFAEVAKGLLRSAHATTTTLGMLPSGTANDQGKSFGLGAGARALERNVRVIADGHVAGLDVVDVTVWLEDRLVARDQFFDSFSIGLSGATLAARNRDRALVRRLPLVGRVYRDQLVYAGALARRLAATYVTDVKFDVDAVIDGVVVSYQDLLDVIVKNTEIFGGEWIFDDDSAPDDGIVEVFPVLGRRDFGAKLLAGFRHGVINLRDLRRLGVPLGGSLPAARSILLTIRDPGGLAPPRAQIDGEELARGDRYQLDVRPRALRVLVPRDPNEL